MPVRVTLAESSQLYFYGTARRLEPVAGAQEYEVQWSGTLNPWRTEPGAVKR